jgi:spore maturation protein SpmB
LQEAIKDMANATFWTPWIKPAMLGTAQAGLPSAEGDLAPVLQGLTGPPEQHLLAAAGATALAVAACRDLPYGLPPLPGAEADSRPVCPASASACLPRLLHEPLLRPLLPEWLAQLARRGEQVPPEYLPLLLETVRYQPHWHLPLLAVLGPLSGSLSDRFGTRPVSVFGLILLFLVVGALRKVAVYESFIEGAKEGFDVAKSLLPYLVAMLCAIGVLRASGALDFGLDGIRWLIEALGWDTRFVDALPTALMKPFSGGAARAMLIETMENFGVDSFPALIAATVQGSTETTFYVLAVYFGAVGLQRARHAVGCALVADTAGIIAAIGVCYWFFG